MDDSTRDTITVGSTVRRPKSPEPMALATVTFIDGPLAEIRYNDGYREIYYVYLDDLTKVTVLGSQEPAEGNDTS